MKETVLVGIFFLFFYSNAYSQLLQVTPEFPTTEDSVTIIFNASQGDAGLRGYVGDVYSHTGVITL